MSNIIRIQRYQSPCGDLLLGSYDGRLCLCDWAVERHRPVVDGRLRRLLRAEYLEAEDAVITAAHRQLDEYFDGKRREFDMPLLFVGTDLQRRVWEELLRIPYGTTVSYGTLARRIGLPTSVRAVANANRANAISIFAPCHRVIGSDGSLTGYGGGLPAKQFLLSLEQPKPQ
ncbi:MAG: methylated-DNA--[protein]-cysteine S-methyltransferase [Bacteroidales bacterium]|nr:methylated-DNA--[protein]-cysteine S-methyltransferase [Bacteroidales bacterium]